MESKLSLFQVLLFITTFGLGCGRLGFCPQEEDLKTSKEDT